MHIRIVYQISMLGTCVPQGVELADCRPTGAGSGMSCKKGGETQSFGCWAEDSGIGFQVLGFMFGLRCRIVQV